jgi:hypothetical protein
MPGWSPEELDAIAAPDEVQIAPARATASFDARRSSPW